MNDSGDSAASHTVDEIQDWMVQYIAKELNTDPDQIDTALPFENFALDSMTAVAMTGDLETWLGRRIDPTVVYDYPTIEEMSQYLAGEA